MNKLKINQALLNFKGLGLIDKASGKPISYAAFKNRATIIRYGTKAKIVFVGTPEKNLFGFYTALASDPETMKEAYQMFTNTVKNDSTFIKDNLIQWTNKGIPKTYTDL